MTDLPSAVRHRQPGAATSQATAHVVAECLEVASEASTESASKFAPTSPVANRLQSVDFSVAIGAAVPRKVELQKLPPQITSVLGGYQGDDYLIVGDQLVIVDQSARRVIAIVPNIG